MSRICEENPPHKVMSIDEFATTIFETEECRIGVEYEMGARVTVERLCGLRLISPFDTAKTKYIYFFRRGLELGRILKEVMSAISVSDHVNRITNRYLRKYKNNSCPIPVSNSNTPQALSLKQLCDTFLFMVAGGIVGVVVLLLEKRPRTKNQK